jgi:DNA phosphorothioation-dependent restriction protein DptH
MGIPSIALDWASEYTDVLPNAIDARKGITINPLELPLGATPYQTALEISSIIRAVFVGIGDIQEALLRNAILEAYKRKGVLEAKPDTWRLNPPTFEDVFDIVQHSDSARTQKTAVQGLLSRISPIVELKLFSGSTTIPFEQLVTRGSSILLGGLYTDELRVVFGHFLLTKLWCYVQNLGGTDLARFYLVLDEANRLAFPGSPLERLVREARKFGVGIIVASQRPRDFTDTVPANAACSIVFQCPLENDATFMAKQINCRAMDIQALEPTFDSLVKFDYAAEVRRVKVVPYLAHAQGYES